MSPDLVAHMVSAVRQGWTKYAGIPVKGWSCQYKISGRNQFYRVNDYRHRNGTHDSSFTHRVSEVVRYNKVKEVRDGERRAGGHVYDRYSVAGREQDVIMYSDKRIVFRMFNYGFFVMILWCVEMRINMFLSIGVNDQSRSQAPGNAQTCGLISEQGAIGEQRLNVRASLAKLVGCEVGKSRYASHCGCVSPMQDGADARWLFSGMNEPKTERDRDSR